MNFRNGEFVVVFFLIKIKDLKSFIILIALPNISQECSAEHRDTNSIYNTVFTKEMSGNID